MASIVIGFRFQNGVFFNGGVSSEDYEKLKSGEKYKWGEAIARQTAAKYNLQVNPVTPLAEIRACSGGFQGFTEGVLYQAVFNRTDKQAEETSDNVWSHGATIQLIRIYQVIKPVLDLPKNSKFDLWKTISSQLEKNGHNLHPDQCSKKMACLRARYKTLKLHESIRGTTKKDWPYYSMMEQLTEADSKPSLTESLDIGNGNTMTVDLGPDVGLVEVHLNPSDQPTTSTKRKSSAQSSADVKRPALIKKEPSTSTADSEEWHIAVVDWTSEAVLALLEQYAEQKAVSEKGSDLEKANMWHSISDALGDEGFGFRPNQCFDKLNSLRASYISYLEDGSEGTECEEYLSQLENLWGCALPLPQLTPLSTDCSDYRYWSQQEVRELLNLYLKHKPLFKLHKRSRKRMEIWRKIAATLKDKGCNKSAEKCEKKMSNLQYRYNQLVQSQQSHLRNRWDHFELMHAVMSDDSANLKQAPDTAIVTGEDFGSTSALDCLAEVSAMTLRGEEEREEGAQSSSWQSGRVAEQGKSLWLPKAATLLVSLCITNKDLYLSSTANKTSFWHQLSLKLRSYGVNFTPSQCDKKIRNLRFRYEVLKAKGPGACGKWRYFGLVDKLEQALSEAKDSPAASNPGPSSDDLQDPLPSLLPTKEHSYPRPPLPAVWSRTRVSRSNGDQVPPKWFRDFSVQQVELVEKMGRIVRDHSDSVKGIVDLLTVYASRKKGV